MRAHAARLIVHLYTVLLRFYPRSFRNDFGMEMEVVFAEAATEAAERGWGSLAGLVWREMRDWPGTVLQAHGRALREGAMDGTMETAVGSSGRSPGLENRHPPIPWREALLAGLPHALVALTAWAMGVAGAYGLLSWGSSALEIALEVVLVVSTVAAMGVARRRGWPRWSASWFAYAFAVVAVPVGMALARWELPLGSWRLGLLLPDAYTVLVVPFLLTMMVLFVGLRNRLRALLTMLPLVVLLWEPALEFTWYPARTIVALLAWVAAAMTAVLIARSGSVRRGVGMALGLSLLVGLAHTYVRTTYARFPPDAPAHYHLPPTVLDWWNRLAPGVLLSAVLILEPLLVRRLSALGQRGGRVGSLGFRVSLAGLMLLLAAVLTAWWWTPWFAVPAALGGLLSLAGASVLAAAAERGGRWREKVGPLSLVFVLTVLPITAALSLASGLWDVRTVPRIWGYVVGVPWLGAGIWLVTRRRGRWVSGAA